MAIVEISKVKLRLVMVWLFKPIEFIHTAGGGHVETVELTKPHDSNKSDCGPNRK